MVVIKLNVGQVFGRLTVVGLDQESSERKWKCVCECGNETSQRVNNLTRGAVVSCGCRKRDFLLEKITKHGMSATPEYKIWENMISRCSCKKAPYFKHYGGRGITVCERWRSSFENFLADMGKRPTPNHELDRTNNDGNYHPSNCRWATRKQQLNNRRDNVVIQLDGVSKTLAEWSEVSGINVKTISYRLRVGSNVKDAIFSKPGEWRRS